MLNVAKVRFFDVYIILFFFVALSASTKSSYLYVTMGLCVILLLWLCYKFHFKVRLNDKQVICVLFFLAYITITGFPVGGMLFTAKQVGAAIIQFVPILVFKYYQRDENKGSRRFVVTGLLLVVTYYMVISYYTYTSIGVSARRMANHSGNYGDLAIGGGYSLAYAVSLLGVYFVDSLKNKRLHGSVQVVGSILIVALATLVIYQTLSTITLIAYILGIVVTLCVSSIDPHSKKLDNVVKPILACLVLCVAVLILSNLLGDILIKVAAGNSTTMGKRLFDLGSMLNGDGSGDYTVGRMSIPLKSFGTFIKNPLFGISYIHGNGYYKASLYGAGNHCEWFDALCNYGLIGGLPYLYIYYSSIKKIYVMQKGKIALGLVVTMFIMGFFNPFRCVQSNVILMLIVPMLCLQHNDRAS